MSIEHYIDQSRRLFIRDVAYDNVARSIGVHRCMKPVGPDRFIHGKSVASVNEPRQGNLVLIAYASSEGSGKPAHPPMTNFNCPCPAIQRGQGSGFLSEGASLNGWTWAVKICHDGKLKDTNLLDAPQILCDTCNQNRFRHCSVTLE